MCSAACATNGHLPDTQPCAPFVAQYSCRVRVWAIYTLFPDYQDIGSWRRRAHILVFGCIKDRETKDIQERLKQQG